MFASKERTVFLCSGTDRFIEFLALGFWPLFPFFGPSVLECVQGMYQGGATRSAWLFLRQGFGLRDISTIIYGLNLLELLEETGTRKGGLRDESHQKNGG